MKRYKTLYDRLKTEYKEMLIRDIKDLPNSVKIVKKGLKSKSFFIDLTIHELSRLSMVLDLDVTCKNVYELFNKDNNLKL